MQKTSEKRMNLLMLFLKERFSSDIRLKHLEHYLDITTIKNPYDYTEITKTIIEPDLYNRREDDEPGVVLSQQDPEAPVSAFSPAMMYHIKNKTNKKRYKINISINGRMSRNAYNAYAYYYETET